MVDFDDDIIDPLEEEFTELAFRVFRRSSMPSSSLVADRRIRAWCGCSALVITKAWHLMEPNLPNCEYATKERFLWGLSLLKTYANEETNAAMVDARPDEGTFRRWAWFFIEELSYLENAVVRV